jgi:hypothetical protein
MPQATQGRSQTPATSRSNPAEAADNTNLQPLQQGGQPTEDAIRARAYALWQQAGEPGGDGAEFWHRAEQELRNGRGPGG